MPIAVPNTTTSAAPAKSNDQASGMSILQVADLDVYLNPRSTEEEKLAECKKVRRTGVGNLKCPELNEIDRDSRNVHHRRPRA